jgi:hypothetical protein
MSQFQRTSSFDEEAYYRLAKRLERAHTTFKESQERRPSPPKTPGTENVALPRTATKQDGPSRSDLEHWYRVLDEMMSVGSHQSSAELRDTLGDLRDDIYAYLH